MKIVIDSNRLIVSLIKESTTREILFNNYFEFYAPSFIKSEIFKYNEEITKKVEENEDNFDLLLNLIFKHITIIPNNKYQAQEFLKKSIKKGKPKFI